VIIDATLAMINGVLARSMHPALEAAQLAHERRKVRDRNGAAIPMRQRALFGSLLVS
jgi:hypothetical protein